MAKDKVQKAKVEKPKVKKQKIDKLGRQKPHKMSIRAKLLMPVLLIIFIVSVTLGGVMYVTGEAAYIKTGGEKVHLAASIATHAPVNDSLLNTPNKYKLLICFLIFFIKKSP